MEFLLLEPIPQTLGQQFKKTGPKE